MGWIGRKRRKASHREHRGHRVKTLDKLTESIIAAAIEVHKLLGPGLLEAVYEEALCHEFELRRIAFERQVPIDMVYKTKTIRGQRLDLLVSGEVVVEIESLKNVPDYAVSQTLSYLRASRLKRGLIINFGERKLVNGIQRVSL